VTGIADVAAGPMSGRIAGAVIARAGLGVAGARIARAGLGIATSVLERRQQGLVQLRLGDAGRVEWTPPAAMPQRQRGHRTQIRHGSLPTPGKPGETSSRPAQREVRP
jgi:hypothetical protein